MGEHAILRYSGSVALLCASILLVITSISTPTVRSIALITIPLDVDDSISVGIFGYCVKSTFLDSTTETCTAISISSPVSAAFNQNDGFQVTVDKDSICTSGMVLHPIAALFAFITCLLAIHPNFCGAIFASVLCVLTGIMAVTAMALDINLYTKLKNDGWNPSYGVATWTAVVAMILIFLSAILVLFSCISGRHRRRGGGQETTVIVKTAT